MALSSKGGSGAPVYVDLAYIPNHCSGKTADLDFFRRVRASYYVVSGNDPANGEPSRAVLDALLEGKAQWGENLQVSSKGHQGSSLVKAHSKGNSGTQSLFIKAWAFSKGSRAASETIGCLFPLTYLPFMFSHQACLISLLGDSDPYS